MNTEELQTAIARTKEKIDELEGQIADVEDSKERRKLLRQLKELQYLQLWHLDQLEANNENR